MAYCLLIFAFCKTYKSYPCSSSQQLSPEGALGQREQLRRELICSISWLAVSLVRHLLLDAVRDVIQSRFVQMSSIFSVIFFTTNVFGYSTEFPRNFGSTLGYLFPKASKMSLAFFVCSLFSSRSGMPSTKSLSF